jgi:hypothetical protein
MAYIFNHWVGKQRAFLNAIFNPASGHDHDGINSKLVTAGVPAPGALAASADGRAIMANNYFDAATAAAKVANDALTNAFCDAKFAANAFAADTDSRAIFADGIWTLAKLAETARTHILSYQVEDLSAGTDISGRAIFEVPTGFAATITSAVIISQGTGTIDGTNKCKVTLTDGENTIAEVEYDGSPAFPAAGSSASLGTPVADHKTLAAGEKLCLSVTNTASGDPPAFMLQVTYTLAEAAE